MEFLLLALTALWLGILTSISPCPLASNIAAVSFISLNYRDKKSSALAGFIYSVGRALSYTLIAFIVVKTLTEVHVISDFLQRYINRLFGFLLIIAGMFMTGLFSANIPSFSISEKTGKKLSSIKFAGPLALGFIFALAICPVAAAIFFGTLIPLSVKANSAVLLPLLYGIGTGLPVFALSFLIAAGAGVDIVYKKIKAFEKYALLITGIIFILVGVYYVLSYVLGVF